jgi:hypothetical protein
VIRCHGLASGSSDVTLDETSAPGAIPALSMPPVIIVPVTMLPAGPGNSSSGRAYCCATPAASRSADDRAGYGASRRVDPRADRGHVAVTCARHITPIGISHTPVRSNGASSPLEQIPIFRFWKY